MNCSASSESTIGQLQSVAGTGNATSAEIAKSNQVGVVKGDPCFIFFITHDPKKPKKPKKLKMNYKKCFCLCHHGDSLCTTICCEYKGLQKNGEFEQANKLDLRKTTLDVSIDFSILR
jgi:hypothetical protein